MRARVIALVVLVLASLSSVRTAGAQAPRSGEDVVRAMHDRYAGSWYPTVTFVQKVIWADGRPEQEWWEALKIPGRLRIDVGPIADPPRTIIFRDATRYDFDHRKLTRNNRNPNLLLVLGFDVYGQAPEATIALLREEGFDLSKVRADRWEGKAVWVVGAAAGDETSKQFWIEQDRLLFLRLVEKNPSGAVSDIRFTRYEPLGKGWLGTVVQFNTNGKETFREVYRDWRVNPDVTEALFDVNEWRPPSWVK